MFLEWSFIASCTLCQSWQKEGENVFLFKILHIRERNTRLCKGELCFILLGGVFTSLLFSELLLASCTPVSYSPIFTCVVTSLSIYACFFIYTIFISVSHMMPWWVLFKCFRKTSCESLSCCELFSCKFFQEFVVGINLFCNTTSGYKLSNLRLLSWLVVLLWFCHGLPNGETVKDIFYVIG